MIYRWQKTLSIVIFGISFALLEAIVVVYLRQIFGSGNGLIDKSVSQEDVMLSLGFIAFLKPSVSALITKSQQILSLEVGRETATIFMLLTLAFVAGSKLKDRFAYFLLAFAVWDVFYYVFLKVLTGWPKSLFDLDVFFLIPVALVGPVVTPIVISFIMILLALFILTKGPTNHEI